MTNLQDHKPTQQSEKFRILFVGKQVQPIEEALSRVDTPVGLRCVSGVADALRIVRSADVDCIIIDQRHASDQVALLVATLAAEKSAKKIIIMTSLESAPEYQALGPKCKVLFYPVQQISLLEAVFAKPQLKPKKPSLKQRAKQRFKTLSRKKLPFFSVSRFMVPVVSFIYKNTALVLLAALFSVFISYGMLIVFFLISTHWGSPLTLSTGHELVTKTQNHIADLRIKRNLVAQRVSKENRETEQAKRRLDDAGVLADFVAKTIDGEIEQRLVLQKDTQRQIVRLTKLRKEVFAALAGQGSGKQLKKSYRKRLINRKTYDSSRLARLELQQRGNGLLSEIEAQRRERFKISKSILMLESMRLQIQQPKIKKIVAANAEFVPLGNQVIEVKTALNSAKLELVSHSERLALLNKNSKIIDATVASLSSTPLARAAKSPITVIFAPYDNLKNFTKGQALYTCRFGVLWCTNVGRTGKSIPGEVVSIHPFFGKNMRGSFVEAILTDREAAKKEVLHVGRPPLFF